jgi:threonine synthase
MVDVGKLAQMMIYDANIEEHGDTVDESNLRAESLAKETGWYQATPDYNPLTVEAEKTISYEVVEQFGVPDCFVVSMGSGGTIYSLWKGFNDLQELKKIEKVPRMIGVQASGCAPIVEAVTENESLPVDACESYTHAFGIFVREPVNGGKALHAIKASGGTAVVVDDSEIFAAEQEVARLEGIFAEPSSSATIAALKKLLDQGAVDGDESVVCLITGSGLKATDVLQALAKKRKTAGVGLDLSTKEKILRLLSREDAYGYALWKKIGKTMTRAAIYQHLNDLARRGAVTSYQKDGRKYFRITERGKRALLAIDDLKMLF